MEITHNSQIELAVTMLLSTSSFISLNSHPDTRRSIPIWIEGAFPQQGGPWGPPSINSEISVCSSFASDDDRCHITHVTFPSRFLITLPISHPIALVHSLSSSLIHDFDWISKVHHSSYFSSFCCCIGHSFDSLSLPPFLVLGGSLRNSMGDW